MDQKFKKDVVQGQLMIELYELVQGPASNWEGQIFRRGDMVTLRPSMHDLSLKKEVVCDQEIAVIFPIPEGFEDDLKACKAIFREASLVLQKKLLKANGPMSTWEYFAGQITDCKFLSDNTVVAFLVYGIGYKIE